LFLSLFPAYAVGPLAAQHPGHGRDEGIGWLHRPAALPALDLLSGADEDTRVSEGHVPVPFQLLQVFQLLQF
jgi:hypothetical protein